MPVAKLLGTQGFTFCATSEYLQLANPLQPFFGGLNDLHLAFYSNQPFSKIAQVLPNTLFGIFTFAKQFILFKSQFLGEFRGNAEVSITACIQQNLLSTVCQVQYGAFVLRN